MQILSVAEIDQVAAAGGCGAYYTAGGAVLGGLLGAVGGGVGLLPGAEAGALAGEIVGAWACSD